jgi:cell division protein FtsI (penicillin-binding protein 3)
MKFLVARETMVRAVSANRAAGAPAASRWLRARISVFAFFLFALFGVIGWRAYQLQVLKGPKLKQLAEQQHHKAIKLPARRGTIYDRRGAPLALSVDVDSVYANPRMVGLDRAPLVARKLSQLLAVDEVWLLEQLRSRRYFKWVKRRIPSQLAAKVKALNIRGVFLQKEPKRYYPNRGLGASVVGFAGLDSKGLDGIELSLDEKLRGARVTLRGLRDARGRPVLSHGKLPLSNHDVVLTLDRAIQHETEQALREVFERHKPKWAAAVVMDPRTGDILAMASVPSYDPNHPTHTKSKFRRNRTITDVFEPGSTLKIFSVAAALKLGVIRDDEVFDTEKGRVRIGRHIIHDSKPYDELSLRDCLKKSSNICITKIALRTGKMRLYRQLREFGFAERSGVPLRGERRGTLRNPKRWSKVGLANIAFGQGMTATVLQLARALTAIGNDGRVMQPRLVLRLQDSAGRLVKRFARRGRRVLSPSLAKRMRWLLSGVTEDGGTAELARLDRYTVAGKTGTAQKVDPKTGTYAEDKWLASFIAVTPATRPRLAIAVIVNEPSGEQHYGGEVAGPVFKRIANMALRYLGVPPDRAASPAALAKRRRAPKRRWPPVDPSEVFAPPLPAEGPAGGFLIPDFTGMSIAEVLTAARRSGLRIAISGNGQAVAQSPGPGPSRLHRCRVVFRPPG